MPSDLRSLISDVATRDHPFYSLRLTAPSNTANRTPNHPTRPEPRPEDGWMPSKPSYRRLDNAVIVRMAVSKSIGP